MKQALIFVLALALPGAVGAQTETAKPVVAEVASGTTVEAVVTWAPLDAADVVLEDLLWVKRPIFVFADSPADLLFLQQMRFIEAELDPLILRDVVVVVDTDPAARSAARLRLRPRGFSLVLMDKDGRTTLRKPLPWSVREITHAIDKFRLRRQEMLEERPAGR